MATRRPKTHTERAKGAQRESRYIDFKREFDLGSKHDWVELIKDFAAMANSGGGAVVIGVENNGRPSRADIHPVLSLDPAKITDQLAKYTNQHFADFEINEVRRGRKKIAVIEVGAAETLLVFERVGTYPHPQNPDRDQIAFRKGTIYFRHGAKSEPATAVDLEQFIEARLARTRKKWLGDIRRVVSAPPGTEIGVFEQTASDPQGRPTEVRLTGDPRAPVFGKLDPDRTHPYRQKELIAEVNKRLRRKKKINSRDVLCVRTVHNISPETHPEYMHAGLYSPIQYSEAFADWLAKRKQAFFDDARQRYYQQTGH